MNRLAPWTLAAALFAVPVGCGSDADPTQDDVIQDESDISDEEWEQLEAAMNPDGKADAPSGVTARGDIQPNTTVSDEVSTGRRFYGYTFRADEATPIAATATLAAAPPASGTVMALYRRTSCLDPWQVVARGAAAMNPALPGPGEYMLVSGARRVGTTGPLETNFSVDQFSKVITPARVANRPYKLAPSWLPDNTQSQLKAAGLKSFSEITTSNLDHLATRTRLPKEVLRELERLKGWLDRPGVTYPMACALKQAGLSTVRDYYSASFAVQDRLKDIIPPGSLPWGPEYTDGTASGLGPCWNLEPPRPNQAARGPYLDWRWWEPREQYADGVERRPWWKGHDPDERPDDPRWLPAPEKGWQLFAYNMGRPPTPTGDPNSPWQHETVNRGPSGFLLFTNRHLGLMRLFVYIPNSKNYNGMVASISLTDPIGRPVAGTGTWSFPVDVMPTTRGVSNLWRIGRPYDDGGQGSFTPTLSLGTWVRAEFPTLFDERVYNAGHEVRLRVGIIGSNRSETIGKIDGLIQASGTALPMTGDVWDSVAVMKDFAVSLGTRSVGAATKRILSWMSDPQDPLRIQLTGSLQGRLGAETLEEEPDSQLFVKLSGTYTPIADEEKWNKYCGWPAYQRCEMSRFAAIGFNPAAARLANGDPRPVRIPVHINLCNQQVAVGSDTTGCVSDLYAQPAPRGTTLTVAPLRTAPWNPARIFSQRAVLEIDGSPAQREATINAQGSVILSAPIVLTPEQWNAGPRAYLRWKATIGTGPNPYQFEYALDVTNALVVTTRCTKRGRPDTQQWCAQQ